MADLRAALKDRAPGEWHYPLAEWLVEGLVEWGKKSAPRDRERYFREALELAREHGLKPEPARSLLDSVGRELKRQKELEDQVGELRQSGQWLRLVALVRREVESSQVPTALPLDRWLYEALCRAGDGMESLEERRQRYREALGVAETHGLDRDAAAGRLKTVERALDRSNKLGAEIKKLRDQRAHGERVALLRFELEGSPRAEWLHPLDRWLYEALLEWGDSLADPEASRSKYARAVETGRAYGFDNQGAALRLKAAEADLARRKRLQAEEQQLHADRSRLEAERNRPADLPRGAQAGIARVVTDHYPPILVAYLWVEDATGKPLLDLKEKDFRVRVDGAQAQSLAMALVRRELVGQLPRSWPFLVTARLSQTADRKGHATRSIMAAPNATDPRARLNPVQAR